MDKVPDLFVLSCQLLWLVGKSYMYNSIALDLKLSLCFSFTQSCLYNSLKPKQCIIFPGTAFGNGTYFAVGASYSARSTYSRPDRQGQKYMYLCRVLTGDFTAGRHGMTVPPAKSTTTVELYNSVTDNPSGPSMFVIFHDNQAYPEYLITFF